MAFLSEEEANRRLNDPRNIVRRVNRGPAPSDISIPAPIIPTNLEPTLPGTEVPTEAQDDSNGHEQQADDSSFSDIFDAAIGIKAVDQDPLAALKFNRLLTPHTPGRKAGIRNRTIGENGSVAVTSFILGSGKTENLFGVPPSTQSQLRHGRPSHVSNVKEELLDEIYRQGRTVTNKAFNRLLASIDLLTDEKLKAISKATEVAGVAKSMSSIIRDLTPKESEQRDPVVQFHIYAPEQVTEDAYETIDVNVIASSEVPSNATQR